MVIAISLVKSLPGHERAVYYVLKSKEGVRNLYHIFGDHDFFMILEAESLRDLAELIDGIRRSGEIAAVDTVLIGKGEYLKARRSIEVPA